VAMRVAAFDHVTLPTNPSGGLLRRVLQGLSDEHEFTVYSVAFDNPAPERIRWVRVPALRRPQVALFVTYHAGVALARATGRFRPDDVDLVQSMEADAFGASLVWAHFCHRAYLRLHWRSGRPSGLRRIARYLDHKARALLEPSIYRQAETVVATSRGLAEELEEEFPWLTGRITVIPNAVDLDRFARPHNFDAAAVRRRLGLPLDRLVVVFVALGHFERKGLPLLLEALRLTPTLPIHLAVVGGSPAATSVHRDQVNHAGLADRVSFLGTQPDVRPFLWASEAFALPSHYETFSLAAFEAAAAGVPIVVSKFHGIEEFLVDGVNGLLVDTTPASIAGVLRTLVELGPAGRARLAERGQRDVQAFSEDAFVDRWRALYRSVGEPSP